MNTTLDRPQFNLNSIERQLWELAQGKDSLLTMASTVQQSIEKVQQIAFRLILVGVVEEVPMLIAPPPEHGVGELTPELSAATHQISQSFLQNLMGFLNGRTMAQAH